MKQIKINLKNLETLIDNISEHDREELIFHFGLDYKKCFIDLILTNKKGTIFLADDNNTPIAIGGVDEISSNTALIWLICSKIYKKNKIKLYKFIKNKLKTYIKKYDILFNYIYKSNFSAQKWLQKFDFIFLNTNNKDIKLFYLLKEGSSFDLRNFTSKQS